MADDLKAYLRFNHTEYNKNIPKLNNNKNSTNRNNIRSNDSELNINKIKASVNGSKDYIIIPNGWVYNLKGTNIQIPERNRDDVYNKYDKYTVINGEIYILDNSSYRYVDDYYEELKSTLDDINNQISELNKGKQKKLENAYYTHTGRSNYTPYHRHTSTSNDETYTNQKKNIENDYNEQIKNLKEKSNYSSITSMISKLKSYAK